MGIENSVRSYLGLFILYASLAFSFLSPLASNTAIPPVIDFYLHTIGIMQGSIALEEGQFPIRVAPNEHNGLGYPKFQFYSPVTYTIAGYIYKRLTPTNPFLALKITIWLGLMIAAFYIYRLAKLITRDSSAAILAGAAYIASPYLLINILARGAFTEAIGQCLLPIVLFYSCQPYLKNNISINNICVTGLMWSMLAMVHLITFVNASIMISLFFLFFKTEGRIKKIFFSGFAYIYGFLLAAWYLGPVIIYQSLLNISNSLINPTIYNYLTLFSRLCGVVSTAIVSTLGSPRTGYDSVLSPPFYPAVGLVTLLAVGLCSYVVWFHPEKFKSVDKGLIKLLLVLFFLAFFLTWSPFDFWKYLPKIFVIEQFSYRFLAQVAWIGALLVAIAINIITNGKNPIQILVPGLLIICLTSSSWLMAEYEHAIPLTNITSNPNVAKSMIGNSDDYLMKSSPQLNQYNNIEPKIMNHLEMDTHCSKIAGKLNCQFPTTTVGVFEFPIIYYPNLLSVTVDGKKVSYLPIQFEKYYLVGLKLNPGEHNIIIKFIGLIWANWISLMAWGFLIGVIFLNLIKSIFKRTMVKEVTNFVF